jgi:gamma-glutamyltranspeptidase/glutathione hydrolase
MKQLPLSRNLRSILLAGAAALLVGCAVQPPSGATTTAAAPSFTSAPAVREIAAVPAQEAVTTANPLATRAALTMLDRGGSPIDAAIAAQMVLGLVEPQSSGIGGGSLIMNWDAAAGKLTSYDGLAAAPARSTSALIIDVDGSVLKNADMQRGGRSVGVPGTLAVLKQVHERYGRLPWDSLFGPAIELAEGGFPMPSYLHNVLSGPTAARDHPDMAALYFDTAGQVLPAGATITHPVYAATMRRIARAGPRGRWDEGAGEALVAAAQRGFRPSLITQDDLAAYRAQPREPVCAPFLVYSVCAMAPPSFGGVVVLQILQMLEARVPAAGAVRFDFDDPAVVHYYAEAGNLAQADRERYVGDPDFARVPSRELVAGAYVRERARAIDPARAKKDVKAGDPVAKVGAAAGPDAVRATPAAEVADATSQLAIVDRAGNALSMTTTINLNFGSRLMVNGFVLNDAMTNFTTAPRPGEAAPNRMEPRKRPVTSMAPVIVFDRSGAPVVVGGSAGGGQIVDYITVSLVEMLANQRTPAQALARGHVSTAQRGKLQLERGTSAASQADALKANGHEVEVAPLASGLGFLMRRNDGWIGAADPRRDGVALGR